MAPKPKSFRKIIETRVKEKRKVKDYNPEVILKLPKREARYIETSKEVNRYKSKTDFEKVDLIKKETMLDAKKRFGESTLIQIKDNIRDPRAPNVPNSLPRKSSLLGMINAFKKHKITNFAIAVTDIKTGKAMGYTVIRLPEKAQKLIKQNFKMDLDNSNSERSFLAFADKLISSGENSGQRYETHLKEALDFQIKHLVMPGYTIDPITRDFRVKTAKEIYKDGFTTVKKTGQAIKKLIKK